MPLISPKVAVAVVACLAVAGGGSQLDTGPPGGGSHGWDATQRANAATIVSVGRDMGVPRRGQVIAVATAMQESGLRNRPDGDRDSAGLFQQRPSQGWGTWSQVTNPQYSARTFYTHLMRVRGWEFMSQAAAAQAVQRSAFPGAYSKWIGDAEKLVIS